MLALINTQKAIYSVLMAGMDEDILDFVPEDEVLPYVTIGDANLVHSPVLGKSIYEMEFNIHAYDKNRGRKNILTIATNIFNLLDNKNLAVTGYTHHETKLITQEVNLVDEGEKYFLSAVYKIVVS